MLEIQPSLFPQRTVEQFVEDVDRLQEEIKDLYCADNIPFVVGYSGGKDSTAVVQLIWNALLELPAHQRTKTVYVITTDTQVENPIVSAWVRQSLEKMQQSAKEQNIPIEPHLLHPDTKNTFWVSLIGKGYPAPRQGFRWCTERLKINPTNYFIRQMIRASGEVMLILGTRKAESNHRALSMSKHEIGELSDKLKTAAKRSSTLRYSGNLPNALVYSPLEDWRNDEVWLYLMQWENPWGKNNQDLFTMYRGATADNECPLVIDTSTPSCGDSRFGCWVCTMVNKDKSMEAMIQNDAEKEWLEPLLDIRNELDIKDDRPKRDFRRIYGKVELFERNLNGETSIEPIPGPYTKYWREYWLRRVLQAQMAVRQKAPAQFQNITLITPEELSEIRRIWLEEKHEFDDSLPKIYGEVMGEPFLDIRPGGGNRLLGSDEWDVLVEICGQDTMHLELMAKLLDTERQFFMKSHRIGIYKDLEKCFETSSRSQDEAIDNAHFKRNLKSAAEQGDIHKIKEQLQEPPSKQLNWGDIKFPPSQT